MLPCTTPHDTPDLPAIHDSNELTTALPVTLASNELAIHGHPQRKLNNDPTGTCELQRIGLSVLDGTLTTIDEQYRFTHWGFGYTHDQDKVNCDPNVHTDVKYLCGACSEPGFERLNADNMMIYAVWRFYSEVKNDVLVHSCSCSAYINNSSGGKAAEVFYHMLYQYD